MASKLSLQEEGAVVAPRPRPIDTTGDLVFPKRTRWAVERMIRSLAPLNPMPTKPVLGYRDIATVLEDSIRYGRYKVGDRLPTEETLAAQFGVTRLTIRRALDVLTATDLIDRKPRRGTIVRQMPVMATTISSLKHYTSLAERIRTTFLGRAQVAANAATAQLFETVPGQPIAEMYFARWRDTLPIAFVTIQVPDWVAAYLPNDGIENARQVNQALADAGIGLFGLYQAIGAQNADPDLALRLGVSPGAAVLRITRDKWTHDRRVFQRMISYFRADLYQYDTEFIDGDHTDVRPDPVSGDRAPHQDIDDAA